MFELKRLSREGVEAALRKAERYRLLNEPWEAESICRDVLHVDPGNQQAVIVLLLALTDQFGETSAGGGPAAPRELLPRLTSEYERAYYAGIICERWAKRLLQRGGPGAGPGAHALLREAMACYERAEPLRVAEDDDAILRWNTCARLIHKHNLEPAVEAQAAPIELE